MALSQGGGQLVGCTLGLSEQDRTAQSPVAAHQSSHNLSSLRPVTWEVHVADCGRCLHINVFSSMRGGLFHLVSHRPFGFLCFAEHVECIVVSQGAADGGRELQCGFWRQL